MQQRLILFGAPGCGKGTQSALLVQRFGFVHLSTGDLLRTEIGSQSSLGNYARSFMDAGNLVPDDVVNQIVVQQLGAYLKQNFILDGFPRTIPQADLLDGFLREHGKPLTCVLYLQVQQDVLIERLTGRLICPSCKRVYHMSQLSGDSNCSKDGTGLIHRPDDTKEAVLHRLEVFERQTDPLRRYYQNQNLLRTLSGEGGPEEVFSRIISSLGLF